MQDSNYKLKFKNNKGFALLIMTAMISLLAITVMICAFVLKHEVDNDQRHVVTLQRMAEAKRALIGRLADVSGGVNVISCGGFISDFGEPGGGVDKGKITEILLGSVAPVDVPPAPPPNWPNWYYDDVNYQFWAGYRGARYLEIPPGQPNPTTEFLDGWGYSLQISFDGDKIKIESLGKDGLPGAADPGSYDEDIKGLFDFKWSRQVEVKIKNTTTNLVNLKVQFIYPYRGKVTKADAIEGIQAIPVKGTRTYTFVAAFPVGSRKVVALDNMNNIKLTRAFCLPSGNGTYTLEEIEYSG